MRREFWRRYAEVSAILRFKRTVEFYPKLDLEAMK
jgi:hypothetical protein